MAKLLSNLWGVPIVARFQGTIVGVDWMKRPLWKLRAWDHVLGLRIPVDLIIMTNDGTQGDLVLKVLGANMERVRFWMNGVDWELFKSLPKKVEATKQLHIKAQRVLLTVSRLVKWKRVDRSIQALPEIVGSFPDTILIIVGDGPERDRLEQLASELGVREHIRFEGALPHKEIPKYLSAADIFLSLYDLSNVGNPLLEAMMGGKCIITINNGHTGRLIRNGENGILLEYKDLPKLSEVIKDLLENDDFRNRLGEKARNFAEENFWSWEERIEAEITEVSQLIEQYEKINYDNR